MFVFRIASLSSNFSRTAGIFEVSIALGDGLLTACTSKSEPELFKPILL